MDLSDSEANMHDAASREAKKHLDNEDLTDSNICGEHTSTCSMVCNKWFCGTVLVVKCNSPLHEMNGFVDKISINQSNFICIAQNH